MTLQIRSRTLRQIAPQAQARSPKRAAVQPEAIPAAGTRKPEWYPPYPEVIFEIT